MQEHVPFAYYDELALEDIVLDGSKNTNTENASELNSMESSSNPFSHFDEIPIIDDNVKKM